MTIGTSAPPATATYAILSSLLGLAFGLLLIAIDMDMMHFAYEFDCMTSLNELLLVSSFINILLFMFYPLFFWIKLIIYVYYNLKVLLSNTNLNSYNNLYLLLFYNSN